MDQLFEIIVPIAFGLFYLLSHLFSKDKEEGEAGRPAEPASEERKSLEEALMERQRQAREAIRKKIEERRGAGGSGSRHTPASEAARQSAPVRLPQPQARETSRSERHPSHPDIYVDVANSAPSHLDQLEERRKAVEITNRQAAALRRRLSSSVAEVPATTRPRSRPSGSRGSYRSRLNAPRQLREAFVLKELLDKPVGLRDRK